MQRLTIPGVAAALLITSPVVLGDSDGDVEARDVDLTSLASFDFDFSESILPGMLPDDPATDDGLAAVLAEDEWLFEVNPYLWAVSLHADIAVDGLTVPLDLGFSDILDALDGVFMTQLRATNGNWMAEVNAFYAKLSLDADIKRESEITDNFSFAGGFGREFLRRSFEVPVDVDVNVGLDVGFEADIAVEIQLTILELFGGYRVFAHEFENGPANPFTGKKASFNVMPYGGTRLTWLDLEIDLRLGASAEVDVETGVRVGRRTAGAAGTRTIKGSGFFEQDDREFWPDAVIGLQLELLDVGKWSITARGDVGGFAIGASSDLVWSVGGRVTYQLRHNILLFAGYHLLDYDYSTGSGVNEFGLDGRLEGPLVGGSIRF